MENETLLTHLKTTQDGYLDYKQIRNLDDVFTPFEFEKFDHESTTRWIHKHWDKGILVGFAYILIVFALQHWMKNRKAFDLRKELAAWNAFVGIFSFCGFWRVAPELFYKFNQPNGLYRSVCVLDGYSSLYYFWGTLFALSKFAELIDTVFIVLRKKPLVVVQWYHHFITLITGWIMLPFFEPLVVYLVFLNYGVHSLMYPYFAVRTLGIKVPKVIAKIITTLQMGQMVTALCLMTYSTVLYYSGVPCYRQPMSLKLSFAVTVTFNILFGELFYKNVVKSRRTKQD